jgi:hypothetical protein
VHRAHELIELGGHEAFLDDEGGAQPQWAGPHHGQVVDGAAHRQTPDVTAGKDPRLDDVGVGGDSQLGPVLGELGRGEDRRIVTLLQRGIAQDRLEQAVDQLPREPATAAVAQHDLLVMGKPGRTDRTLDRLFGRHRVCSATSAKRSYR